VSLFSLAAKVCDSRRENSNRFGTAFAEFVVKHGYSANSINALAPHRFPWPFSTLAPVFIISFCIVQEPAASVVYINMLSNKMT